MNYRRFCVLQLKCLHLSILFTTNFKAIFYINLETITILKYIAVGWISSLGSITYSLDEPQ